MDYNTYKHLNRNIYMLGLTTSQFLVIALSVMSSLIIYLPIGVIVTIVCIIISKKISKRNKQGYRNISESVLIAKKTPKVIEDRENILNLITNEEN